MRQPRAARTPVTCESLEGRQLLSAGTATLDSNGLLRVEGTRGNDLINVITYVGKGAKLRVAVRIGDTEPGGTFLAKDVKQVEIVCGEGNDGVNALVSHSRSGASSFRRNVNGSVLIGLNANHFDPFGVPVRLFGGAGNDFLRGGTAADLIEGGVGDDTIRGGFGNDTIRGEDGKDQLHGDAGADLVYGGGGDDRLLGDLISAFGDDSVFGGNGDDLFLGDRAIERKDVTAGDHVL